jgi:hypothetical protein
MKRSHQASTTRPYDNCIKLMRLHNWIGSLYQYSLYDVGMDGPGKAVLETDY